MTCLTVFLLFLPVVAADCNATDVLACMAQRCCLGTKFCSWPGVSPVKKRQQPSALCECQGGCDTTEAQTTTAGFNLSAPQRTVASSSGSFPTRLQTSPLMTTVATAATSTDTATAGATTMDATTTAATTTAATTTVTGSATTLPPNAPSTGFSSESLSSTDVVSIAGAVGGAVAALFVVAAIVFFVCRAKAPSAQSTPPALGSEMSQYQSFAAAKVYDVGNVPNQNSKQNAYQTLVLKEKQETGMT